MKQKRWIALLLAAVLTVGALSVTAFAAKLTEPEAEASAEESAAAVTEPAAEASAEESTAKPARGKHGHREKVAEPENAVGKDAAKERALAEAGVNAENVGKVKARVTKLEDGTVVYRVSFTAGDQWYCFKIDALSGEILDRSTEDAAAHEAAKAARGARSGETAETTEEGTESTGRGHRHGGRKGSLGTGSDEGVPETEKTGGRKHGAGSKSEEPASEEGGDL